MGLRATFDRRTREMVRKTAFRRDDAGRLLYIPGGADNPLSWHAYVVPDEATADMLTARYLPGFRAWIMSLLLLVAILGVVAAWQPTELNPLLIVALVPFVVLAQGWFPVAIGRRLAREADLQGERRFRSAGQLAEAVSQDMPPAALWALAIAAGLGALFIVFVLVRVLLRGDLEFALFLAILALPGLVIPPGYLLALRERRIKAANAKLESIVRERTAQLRELHEKLKARVAEQVAHMDRLGQLRHFFAAPVAELILRKEGFDPSRVHRKELSVISIDLRGFTAFAEAAEPEEVIGVLRAYHTRLGEVVNKHQATLEHFAGESAMVFLNDPLDAPDHPRRAIAMTVELRARVAPMIEEWRRQGYDLGWGAGIATGYATIGTVGYEGRWEYAAIGSVCNLAARLCAQAHDGQIVTTHRVLSRAGDGIELEPMGDLTMKGISRPLAGFNVLSLA
jgi:class 3 adenylate cyclase